MDKVSTDDNSWISILNVPFLCGVKYCSCNVRFQVRFVLSVLFHYHVKIIPQWNYSVDFYHDCNVKCVQYTDCVATKLLPVYTSNKTIAPIGWIWLVFQTLRRRFMCPNTSFFFVINNCLLQKHGVLTM